MINKYLKYKNPLRVVCINPKGSSKLIKNGEYKATALLTQKYGTTIFRNISIKDIGSYKSEYFTLIDGTPLTNEPDFITETKNLLDPNQFNYTGKYVRCAYSSSKNLKVGEIYYVEKQISELVQKQFGAYTKHLLKIRGIKNKIAPYNFSEISMIDERKLKFDSINGESIITGDKTRKFLQYSEKEKIVILLEGLTKVIVDIYKLENIKKLNINTKRLIVKKCKRFDVIEDDIDDLISMDFKTLLKKFDM